MFLLGYDIGSSSVKASLVNAETGKCVSSAFFPKTEAKIIAVNPGWAEQDPESGEKRGVRPTGRGISAGVLCHLFPQSPRSGDAGDHAPVFRGGG